MNWNIPKTSMDLDLSLVLMAIFYSTFSICFIYLLFITCCLPCNFVMIDQLMMWWLKKYFQNVNISSNGKKWNKVAAKYVPFIIDIFSMWFEEFSSMKNCEKVVLSNFWILTFLPAAQICICFDQLKQRVEDDWLFTITINGRTIIRSDQNCPKFWKLNKRLPSIF